MIKIKSICVALNLFCFGHFFPIPKISTPAKVIVAAIHSARATAAKLEIMDGFAFDDISTFLHLIAFLVIRGIINPSLARF